MVDDHVTVRWRATHLPEAEQAILSRVGAFVEVAAGLNQPLVLSRAKEDLARAAEWNLPLDVLVAALLAPMLQVRLLSKEEAISIESLPAEDSARVHVALAIEKIEKIEELHSRWIDGKGEPDPEVRRGLLSDLLRKLYALAYDDNEAALLFVAQQLSALREFEHEEVEERQQWARALNLVIMPFLKMCSMWRCRRELGDQILSDLGVSRQQLATIDRVSRKYSLRYDPPSAQQPSAFYALREALVEQFAEHGLKASVGLHKISRWGLYELMLDHAQRGESATTGAPLDLMHIDILVRSEPECYQALGIIHRLVPPAVGHTVLGGRFRDYMARPLPNGYRSLVTTAVGEGQPPLGRRSVEFRIRTYEMEQVNDGGIIFAKYLSPRPLNIQNVWWDKGDLRELIRAQRIGSSAPTIYVLSPTGEAHLLPGGSTPVDFAFKIHSELGPYARVFRVNGLAVPFDQELRNGDLVEIEADREHPSAKVQWLAAARTREAGKRIRQFLKQRDASPHRGRRLLDMVLERELPAHGLRMADKEIEAALAKVAHRFDYSDLPSLYQSVAQGNMAPDKVAFALITNQLAAHIAREDGKDLPVASVRLARCRTLGVDPNGKQYTEAARILPGAAIVGREVVIGNHVTLVVHRQDCLDAPPDASAVLLRWRGTRVLREAVEIVIAAVDRTRLLDDILQAFYDCAEAGYLYLHHVTADVSIDRMATVKLVVDAPDLGRLEPLRTRLDQMRAAGKIRRVDFWAFQREQNTWLTSGSRKRYRNPYTATNGLHNASMFFGRHDEIRRIQSALADGHQLVVLYGQERIGKTSLLQYLARSGTLDGSEAVPVYVDLLRIPRLDVSSLVAELVRAADQQLAHWNQGARRRRVGPQDLGQDQDAFRFLERWVAQTVNWLQGRKIVFLVDEFTKAEDELRRGELDRAFFTRFLAFTARAPEALFVLSVHESVLRQLTKQGEAGINGVLRASHGVTLPYLDEASATQLILQPMGDLYTYDGDAVEGMLELSGRHPFFLHQLCYQVVDRMNQVQRARVSLADVEAAADRLLAVAPSYFQHFVRDADGDCGKVVLALACAQRGDWSTPATIGSLLRAQNWELDEDRISQLLVDLWHQGATERQSNSTGWQYRLVPVGLLARWIRRIYRR